LVAQSDEKHEELENSQVRRHEEDSAGRLRLHPAKSSGLQEYQANLARRFIFCGSPALALGLSARPYRNFIAVLQRSL